MPAIHLRAYGSELPECRWKEAYRNYILTDDKEKVTCKKCLGTIHFIKEDVVRVDKYHLQIGGINVVATNATEQRIRELSPKQLHLFKQIFREER